jgi:hypothetical protein
MAALFERLARNAEERVASERASRRLLPAPPARRLIAAADGKDTGHKGTSIPNERIGVLVGLGLH